MKVAIFDFDGTLFPEETFPLMMKHLKTHPQHAKRYRYFFAKILPIYVAYKCKLYPEKPMKAHSMWSLVSSFGSAKQSEVDLFFRELGRGMSEKLSGSVLERFEQHRKDGYYTMLVSGAFEPLLYAATDKLAFDSIIGTQVPISNKKSEMVHVHGEKKIEKVKEKLANYNVDWNNSFAYGDSFADVPVLELVGHPVAVKPESRLLQIAQDRNWEILSE